MYDNFFKFPSTPHLAILDDTEIRSDKVMSEQERNEFLSHRLILEEKVDGANLGISFDAMGNISLQNRGSWIHLPGSGQWKKLAEWLTPKRTDRLIDHLADRFIIFGEWCYARHSVVYDRLPDWFLGFDVYDKIEDCFTASIIRNNIFHAIGICQVPEIKRGHFTLSELNKLLSKSQLGKKPAEGLYLRFEQKGRLVQRAKLVRPDFIQSIGRHWAHSDIKTNMLEYDH